MTTAAFAAVGCPRWETCVALSADLLVAVVLCCEDLERGFDDSATKTRHRFSTQKPESVPRVGDAPEDEVEGRLFLDVVVTESTTVFELFTSKNKTLLVRGDTIRT